MARQVYHVTGAAERDAKKKHLAKILSVSDRTIRPWLSRIDKDARAERNQKIFDLWMQCYTQQEIADVIGCVKAEVSGVCSKTATLPNLNKSDKSAAEHVTHFTRFASTALQAYSVSEAGNLLGGHDRHRYGGLLCP